MSSTRIEEEIEKAVEYVRRGQVILYPSDTLWALTCDIYNKSATERLKKIKKSVTKGQMILAVNSIDMLKSQVRSVHPRIETLLLYHNKPLSIIYDAPHDMPEYLISDQGTIAVRVVNDHFSKELITQLGQPIISSTAMVEGEKSLPKKYEDISAHVKKEVDHIVDLKSIVLDGMPSILARYNHKGDLEFIRR